MSNETVLAYFKSLLLSQVCIPGLHISLGIFNRLWDLLENACTQLDLELAKESDGMDGNTFERYGQALHKAAVLREQLKVEQQHLVVVCNLATYLMLNLPNPAGDLLWQKLWAKWPLSVKQSKLRYSILNTN